MVAKKHFCQSLVLFCLFFFRESYNLKHFEPESSTNANIDSKETNQTSGGWHNALDASEISGSVQKFVDAYLKFFLNIPRNTLALLYSSWDAAKSLSSKSVTFVSNTPQHLKWTKDKLADFYTYTINSLWKKEEIQKKQTVNPKKTDTDIDTI